jgi:hypothetical protein
MLAALAKALEARDPYTRGHSARVTALAVAVARRLGWSDERIAAGASALRSTTSGSSQSRWPSCGRPARCSRTSVPRSRSIRGPELVEAFLDVWGGSATAAAV